MKKILLILLLIFQCSIVFGMKKSLDDFYKREDFTKKYNPAYLHNQGKKKCPKIVYSACSCGASVFFLAGTVLLVYRGTVILLRLKGKWKDYKNWKKKDWKNFIKGASLIGGSALTGFISLITLAAGLHWGIDSRT